MSITEPDAPKAWPPLPVRLGMYGLTDAEAHEIRMALLERQAETSRYLVSYGPRPGGHDDCCETARARAADQAEQRAALEERARSITSALRVIESGLPKPEEII